MFTISTATLGEMERHGEQQFVAKLGAVLKDTVPELAHEPEPDFSIQVRLVIARARAFGLQSEQAVGIYAVSAGLLGMDFADRFPAVARILESREDEARKAELLENFTLALLGALQGAP